jgi:multidrug efflux system membrane fusion protein
MQLRMTVIALAAAVAAAACRGASGEASPGAAPVVLVRTAPVREAWVAPPVTGTGMLAPKEEIALSFKIGGVVSRIPVDVGTRVAAGDTLAALDLREIDAAVARATSGVEKADRDLARAQRLYRDSVFTLSQLQDTRTQAQVAHADLETASFNRRYSVIIAPAAGVILHREAEPGELVASGRPVLVLGSHARGSVVRVGLADRDVVRLRRGDRAAVRFEALPGRTFTGAVSEIAAASDPGTGTYAVEVALHGAAGLASGLVGRVEIQPSVGQRGPVIPIEALLEADGEHATVYVLSPDGSRAERRQVTVGALMGDSVAITSGLEGAGAVVTEGAAYLRDGQAVREAP